MLNNNPTIQQFAAHALTLCKSDRKPEDLASLRELFVIAQQAGVNLSRNSKLAQLYLNCDPILWLDYGGSLSWPVEKSNTWLTLLDENTAKLLFTKSHCQSRTIEAFVADADYVELFPPYEQLVFKLKRYIAIDEINSFNSPGRFSEEVNIALTNAWSTTFEQASDVFSTNQHIRLIQDFSNCKSNEYVSALILFFKQRGANEAITVMYNSDGRSRCYDFTHALLDGISRNTIDSSSAIDVLEKLQGASGRYRLSVVEALTLRLSHWIYRERSSFTCNNAVDFILKDWPSQLLGLIQDGSSPVPFMLYTLLIGEKVKSPAIASTSEFNQILRALREYVIDNKYGVQRAIAHMTQSGNMLFSLTALATIDDPLLSLSAYKTIAEEVDSRLNGRSKRFYLFESIEETRAYIQQWPSALIKEIGLKVSQFFWEKDPRMLLENMPGIVPLFKALADAEQWDSQRRVKFATTSRSLPVRLALIKGLDINPQEFKSLPNKLRRELLSSDLDI